MQPFSATSKLASLTPAQKDQVASWLLDDDLSLSEAVLKIEEVFGFKMTRAGISKFWHRECAPRKLLRSAETARSVESVARTVKTDWQDTNAQLMGQKIFEALSDPMVDLKTVCQLGSMLERIKRRGLSEKTLRAKLTNEKHRFGQKERQMTLDREKFEFNAVEAVLKQAGKVKSISADRALSSDEKRDQLRRLLFPQAFEPSPT